MIISIHPDRVGSQSYSEKWAIFLKQRKVKVKIINLYKEEAFEQVKNSDGFMWRWSLNFPERVVAPILLSIIEKELNIPVYPDYKMRFPWDNKIKQFYLFKAKGIKMPRTWIFWDENEALRWIESTDFPLVFKLSSGASSRNIYLIRTVKDAKFIIKRMFNQGISTSENIEGLVKSGIKINLYYLFRKEVLNLRNKLLPKNNYREKMRQGILNKNYVYFQEYFPYISGTHRVAIIGDRAFGYYRYNPSGDFRADPSGKRYDVSPNKIPLDLIKKAFEIKNKLNIDCIGMDFLIHKSEFYLLEICWTFPDYKLHKCPGHWNSKLEWIEGQMWPEEAQVIDFIERIKNKRN